MLKFAAILSSLLILPACSGHSVKQTGNIENAGYFADATDCLKLSKRSESVKVPTGGTMSTIDIPTVYDANYFGACMKYADHPSPTAPVDLEPYLKISHDCLQDAHHSPSPDNAYAECIKRSKIEVETLPK